MKDGGLVRIIFLKTLAVCLLLLAAASLAGCDPVNRHKALTTLFDGVPTLPPAQQLCADYTDKRLEDLRNELTGKLVAKEGAKVTTSQHLPYLEKRCNGCHDKSTKDGLVAPRNQLCFVCHKEFIKGSYVHGPVAVADCLACHVPHNSAYPFLLKTDRSLICGTCHQEKRVAAEMHDKLTANRLACVDCHNPHFGGAPFFLK